VIHVLGEHGVAYVVHASASIFWSDRNIRQINKYSMLLRHGWRLIIERHCSSVVWATLHNTFNVLDLAYVPWIKSTLVECWA